jgi:hypothetical protein
LRIKKVGILKRAIPGRFGPVVSRAGGDLHEPSFP